MTSSGAIMRIGNNVHHFRRHLLDRSMFHVYDLKGTVVFLISGMF